MANVKRGDDGSITHILVDGKFRKKEDASKIMYESFKRKDILEYLDGLPPDELLRMVLSLLNEQNTVYQEKARILTRLGQIEDFE